MNATDTYPYIAFDQHRCIARGELNEVVEQVKPIVENEPYPNVLIFDSTTSRPVEVDFRGTLTQVLERLTPVTETPSEETTSPTEDGKVGRPKLGVVAREVTLLPRHWEWLATQPGSASVTLRKLVEEAKRASQAKDAERQAEEAFSRFLTAVAGDLAGYEEASRAFYRREKERFEESIAAWPEGIREHARVLANRVEW